MRACACVCVRVCACVCVRLFVYKVEKRNEIPKGRKGEWGEKGPYEVRKHRSWCGNLEIWKKNRKGEEILQSTMNSTFKIKTGKALSGGKKEN